MHSIEQHQPNVELIEYFARYWCEHHRVQRGMKALETRLASAEDPLFPQLNFDI